MKIDRYIHTHRNTRKSLFAVVVVVADLMRNKKKTNNGRRRTRVEKGKPDRRMIKIIK